MRIVRNLIAALAIVAAGAALAQTSVRRTVTSAAQEGARAICLGSCTLSGFQVNNWDTGNAVTVMLFESASTPVDGTVAPIKWYGVAAAASAKQPGTIAVLWTSPLILNGGATLVCSATGPFTKTAAATCTFSADVQ